MKKNVSSGRRPEASPEWFGHVFEELINSQDKPRPTVIRGGTAYRFPEETVSNAVLLKLARYISGLNAGRLLLANGYVQELCTLQRTLDEVHEDILFLCYPQLGLRKEIEAHKEYLASFWEEEPDFRLYAGKQKNKHQVRRAKIRSYLSKLEEDSETDHRSIAVSGYLNRLYSGYVHAAAPQLYEIYDPDSRGFSLSGYTDSALIDEHTSDFQNQVFRGVISVIFVARLCGRDEIADYASTVHNYLEPYYSGQ